MEVWELLSNECREEVVLIECDCLMETLENYLRKHRLLYYINYSSYHFYDHLFISRITRILLNNTIASS